MYIRHRMKNSAETQSIEGRELNEEKTRTILKLMKEVINEAETDGTNHSGVAVRDMHGNAG